MMQTTKTLRGVIDIGTVTTRLMVAMCWSQDGGASVFKVEQLAKKATITNLGEGVAKSGVLKREAVDRVIETIKSYISAMDELGLAVTEANLESKDVIAIATSAARDASNSNVLVRELESLGIPLVVISGDREATLSFRGATAGHSGEGLLVCDIGGGSTELILGDVPANGGASQITRKKSFNVGCRRVTEMFLLSDPPAHDELQQAAQWSSEQIQGFFEGVDISKIIGVAGTATSLVSIWKSMEVYDSTQVHGQVMDAEQVREVLDRLSGMTLEERRKVVGLQPQRADVIVAGLLILSEILRLAGVDEFTVSESDNMMGLMLDWPC